VNEHYGLKSMQERAELAGGQLTVVSGHGKGTTVETVVPMSSAAYRHAS
jgi:signal transduction histidine kinase